MSRSSTPRILLVEDSNTDAKLIERWLKLSGIAHELRVISDGAAAMKLLSSNAPKPVADLILLDLNLPSFSGCDLLEAAKCRTEYADIPIIVFIDSQTEAAERLKAKPRCFCQAKPRDAKEYEDLVAQIKTLLAERP